MSVTGVQAQTESGVARFFRAGVDDAARRLSRFVACGPEDDGRVVALLESSRIVRAVSGAYGTVLRAHAHSWAAGVARRVAAAWRASGAANERRFLGTVLLAAVTTHVAMTLWQEAPPGWFWLVLPAIAAAVGVVLILASDGPVERPGHE